ncbi:MAG TPA: fibronectin type III domain-containing protein [Candidatus Udaeobacter sp.]|nr:fibronectin type III domain-containing protein [Candidatus Udaeobacter sp.]
MTRKRIASSWLKSWQVALAAVALLGLGLAGCDEDTLSTVDENELAPPLGLQSVTGNGQVSLFWYTSNFEDGFEGYIVFLREGGTSTNQSSTLPAGFTEVARLNISGSSNTIRNTVIQDLENGTQYTFAVCAFRNEGDEISLASNIVSDSPRPDITSVTLTSASTGDVTGNDQTAGFDFDTQPDILEVVSVPTDLAASSYNSANGADIVHEAFDPGQANNNIRSWIAGMNGDGDSGVQDLGFMADLNGADVAPVDGYAGNGNSVLLSAGHVYAVKTGENHYGKFIVTAITTGINPAVTFNAAIQTRPGDPNYFPALGIH